VTPQTTSTRTADSARLVMLRLILHEAILIASDPSSLAPQYRPADRDIRRCVRDIVRECVAARWRDDLQRSVDSTRVTRPVVERNVTRGPGFWTGD
jgi:hypothetical protein